MAGAAAAFLEAREQPDSIDGTIKLKAPAVAVLPRKLRLEMRDFFMVGQILRMTNMI
jgi:hypothetical protein